MPRLSTVFALLVPLVATIVVFRSLDVSARLQLSWPLALHPDAQDDGVQVAMDIPDGSPPLKQYSDATIAPGAYRRRIVAVGDLHGDLPNAYKVLKMAGVVTKDGHWSGDVDYFVQTGDIIDRSV